MQARLVLVHSPLVGCGTWEPVARDLGADGYPVTVPDLAGTVTAGPPYHLRQAQLIADSAAGQPAILVGHSGAGPLLATAGTMLGEGARGYIFVDAGLPVPGRSWMETAPPDLAAQLRAMADPQGWLPPWSQWWGEEELAVLLPDQAVRQHFAAGCPRLPLAMFEEAHPPVPGWPTAPGGYLQLSEAYEDEAARARELGWPVRKQLRHHLALLAEPGQVARELRQLIGEPATARYLDHEGQPSAPVKHRASSPCEVTAQSFVKRFLFSERIRAFPSRSRRAAGGGARSGFRSLPGSAKIPVVVRLSS